MSEVQQFYAHGKLLLSGEYFILNGAVGLALPSRYGQHLRVEETKQASTIRWQSFDDQGNCWFEVAFAPEDFQILSSTDVATADRLQQIFRALLDLSDCANFLQRPRIFKSRLEFPRDWGLGSSSTLLASLAQWAAVDSYQLLDQTFGGSGYDLACAISPQALLYQRRADGGHAIRVSFSPAFRQNLHFVHLNRKQNSREGIRRFRKKVQPSIGDRDYLSSLSFEFLTATDLATFQKVMEAHEDFIAGKLGLPKVKDQYFADFPGSVKSLGAWGGDFAMVASAEPAEVVRAYFIDKGMDTVLGFGEMVL